MQKIVLTNREYLELPVPRCRPLVAVQAALDAILEVHCTDQLMWLEVTPPYQVLDEVRARHACC